MRRLAQVTGRRLVAVVLATWLVCGQAAGSYAATGRPDDGHAPIAYVGAVLTSLVYLPLKLAYAGVGGLVGGAAYLVTVGNGEAARGVWDASMRGDYVVTPAMLEGRRPVRFAGR